MSPSFLLYDVHKYFESIVYPMKQDPFNLSLQNFQDLQFAPISSLIRRWANPLAYIIKHKLQHKTQFTFRYTWRCTFVKFDISRVLIQCLKFSGTVYF